MHEKLKRREFIGRIAALTVGSIALGACNRSEDPPEPPVENEIQEDREIPRDLVLELLDQKVDHYMQVSSNCAQSSYLALEEEFGLDGGEIVKALTPLPGIAERGETCGAVIGPLMILGLIYGRDRNHLSDWHIYRQSLVPAGKFCRAFELEYGSTMCRDIQKVKFGRCFDLSDPDELRAFQEAGATSHCSAVVRSGVRIAAEILLDDAGKLA